MGWLDTIRRYRRTLLGPFWTSLSVAVFIGTVGIVYSGVFGQDISVYLPFLCSGFVVWAPLVTFVTESCGVLAGAEGILKQARLPYTIFILSGVVRNLVVFAHHLLVFIVVALIFHVKVNLNTLLVFPAIVLLSINAVWVGLLVSICCTRFRDLTQIISSLMQVAFFITPIFWTPGQASGWRGVLVVLNPLYHFVDILRSPLLGEAPSQLSWMVVAGASVLGWGITLTIFNRLRSRLIYWM